MYLTACASRPHRLDLDVLGLEQFTVVYLFAMTVVCSLGR